MRIIGESNVAQLRHQILSGNITCE
jgi:Asp-tRNA(Asn)/Glu-tRNA(Gln) amidotransferase A subunit family amidase